MRRALAVLAGIVVLVLVAVAAVEGWIISTLRKDVSTAVTGKAQAEADLEVTTGINDGLNRTIDGLRSEIQLRDDLTTQQLQRISRLSHDLEAAEYRLSLEAQNDPTLDSYLRSAIHPSVVGSLWVDLPDEEDGGGHQGGAPASSGQPAGGYASPAVAHIEGWEWCRATHAALMQCNGDKAALRDWKRQVLSRLGDGKGDDIAISTHQ